MRRKLIFLALVVAVIGALVVSPAGAQEQTGSIEGLVKDAEGAVLPGVTLEATSGSIGTLVVTTDAAGRYRFPRLPSGVYDLKASLDGYKPAESKGINLQLGQILTVNLALEVGTFEETIVVTGEGAQIDVSQSATATSISREQIALLPKGRDFSTIVSQAQGASNETFLAGISIDGASGSENRFIIDGTDITQPMDGNQGQMMVTDFVEEVQVKSAGYAAEYGGAVGGVINVITKSGTNEFAGSVGAYYTDSSWEGKERPTYRQELAPTYQKTFAKDDVTRIEPGFSLGGPLARDKAWFFVAYQPARVKTERTPDGASLTADQTDTTNFGAVNLKGNAGSKLLYKLSANLTPRTVDGSLPAKDGSTPANADLEVTTETPTASYSAYADFVPSSRFYMSGRLGYFDADTQTDGIEATTRFFFRNGDLAQLGYMPTSDSRYRPTGFSSVPAASFDSTDEDHWKRQTAGIDGNLFVSALGSHSFKAGVQLETVKNSVSDGANGNLYEIRWGLADRYGIGVKGTYGSVAVARFRTEGGAEAKNTGLFLQDAWQIRPNFTLNVGVRTEKEEDPNYGAKRDPSLPKNAIEFGFGDKLAPRVGFAWDVMSDQRWKVYGSYGKYYDITKLEMPRGSFGGDQWVTHVYPLETLDWETLDDGCAIAENNQTQNPCPNLGAQMTRDLREPTDPRTAIDPDLRPMGNQEYQLGLDHQLTPNSVLGVRYVNKELLDTIEDIGYVFVFPDGTSTERYTTGNPGKGIVGGDPAGPVPPQAKAVREYEAIEFSWNRRFVDNWSLRAGYTWSKLEGNYSGLASSDEFGRDDPNVSRSFDSLAFGYDSKGRQVFGPLNTDRPHVLEAQLLYRLAWGTNLGINTSWASGTPVSTHAAFNGTPPSGGFPYGRNDVGRTPSISQTDLLISHPFKIGEYTLEASVNVTNLLDEDTVTRIGNNAYFDDICDVNPDCDTTNAWYFGHLVPYDYHTMMQAGGATPDPQYKRALAYQAPRSVRLALKFAF